MGVTPAEVAAVAPVVGVGSLLPLEADGVAVAEDPQATNKAANNRIKA